MDEREMECENKKGYLKIHVAVDVKTKKILSMKEVTDEHVHDSKMLPELVQNIIKSNSATASKLFADGAYDSNEIFRYLGDNGILPCIKVRKRMQELDGKKETFLEIYQFWPRKKIYKNGGWCKIWTEMVNC